jgi:two-component system sensor histidine kinase KdpD
MRGREWSLRLGGEPPPLWLGLLATLAAVAASTLIVYLLKPISPVVSLGVVYLPAILAISIFWGLRLGLLASLASVVAFNFFHIPPLHRFTIGSDENWVALAIFAIVAVASSALAGLARSQALEAERRREEADRALAELAALSRERDRMQEEMVEAEALRRSDELKTALLRSISHDLRTPLTSIIAGGAALGSATLTEGERAELSAAIVAGGERLSRLVENLLDMSRLEAGKAEPHREQTDLGEVLDVAREAVTRPELVRLVLDRDLPVVEADAAQLERAFANLLENAIRHGGGRPVTVRSRLVGEKIAIRVVDQGPGIPESEWERIFEPFQSGATNGAGGGSGLGLAIARGFVEANGGEIAVESVLGQGSSFVVGLPRGKQAAA